ncbi:unnamed protein product [Didymodactylos carnosus]|uniref:Integrase zinc-binding domain-containing protein n=1 Tax=Didymodactylos carnosus TaxID=1234261 RepID=A0A815MMH1_9BILA|nr:unnamed protein product [Didymodactylos carnosus]CAF4302961.1 unnamed protein product [Didymodactylos carnosus]
MLCIIVSHFDSLGLISPIIQRAKWMIQKLWKLNLDWDVPVPKDVESEWKELEKDLKNISEISVSRFIGIKNSLGNEAVVTELHCFYDSSATAYAACVYVRVEQNREITTNLSFTKTRLAPIKTLTVPRLELMAALIGVRIPKFVEKELKIKIVKKYIWCDSKCVLYWIANKRLKSAFVENRLKEIRLCENTEFRYVSMTENPADLPTRGMSTLGLKTSNLSWNGPEWLHQGKDQWPDKLVSSADEIKFEEIENRKTATLTMVTVADNCTFGSIIKKYSTLTKSLRVIAYTLRAKKIFEKIDTRKGTLSVEELNDAQKLLDKLVQGKYYSEEKRLINQGQSNGLIKHLRLFIDDEGLIRCNGRLKNPELSEGAKTPILLPKRDRYVELIIENIHKKLLHSGSRHILSELRQNYWLPTGRRIIESIIKKCWACKKWEGGPFQPPVPPALPKERLLEAPAFTFSSIHGSTWETEGYYNGKQFRLANTTFLKFGRTYYLIHRFKITLQMKELFGNLLSNWRRGWVASTKRLVGLVKRNLRKTIDSHLLTYRQLETVVIEVESVINSRPLGFVGSTLDDGITLTPALFLGIDHRTGFPEIDIDKDDADFKLKEDSSETLLKKLKKDQKVLDIFWKTFRDDYLLSLRERKNENKIRGAACDVPQVAKK